MRGLNAHLLFKRGLTKEQRAALKEFRQHLLKIVSQQLFSGKRKYTRKKAPPK